VAVRPGRVEAQTGVGPCALLYDSRPAGARR